MNGTSGNNLAGFLDDQKQIGFDWFLIKIEFKNKAYSFLVKIMMANLNKFSNPEIYFTLLKLYNQIRNIWIKLKIKWHLSN